jgi:excinuclease ABC subunit C
MHAVYDPSHACRYNSPVAAPFEFAHRIDFSPENAEALLRDVPAAPGVFALRGEDADAEPYLTRAADLRRRMRRLLAPPEAIDDNGNPILSKRLNLRNRVRFIEYTQTGSEFESTLLLYNASRAAFGAEEARRRLRLHPPYFLRVTMSQEHPRVYSTNRLSKKSLAESFGPFPSRAVAERYCDAVLDLFLLRRCYEDLAPSPEHPGCVYGEMNKCMRPCQQGAPTACTLGQYAAEATRVHAFFTTRGQSLLDEVAAQREAASEAMDFEAAAALHKHWEKVRAASLLADELVRSVPDLRAVVLQEASPLVDVQKAGAPHLSSETWASTDANAAVFLLEHGHIAGPERLSTLGVRAVREQTAVGSSLFAQPLMLAPVPLVESIVTTPTSENPDVGHPATSRHIPGPPTDLSSRPERSEVESGAPDERSLLDEVQRPAVGAAMQTPEDRARATLARLAEQTEESPEINDLCDTLSLFRRWYYRPEKQQPGEVFLPNPDHGWPIRRILNGAARVVLGPPTATPAVDREAAKTLKTKVIHAGREGVEREVPVLPKRLRTRKAITPTDFTG